MKTLSNLLWLVLAGFWLAVGYAVGGLLLCVTIIGIPFGIQSFKLAGLAMAPLAREIVSTDDPRYFVQE